MIKDIIIHVWGGTLDDGKRFALPGLDRLG